jgi:hypothetical protein
MPCGAAGQPSSAGRRYAQIGAPSTLYGHAMPRYRRAGESWPTVREEDSSRIGWDEGP